MRIIRYLLALVSAPLAAMAYTVDCSGDDGTTWRTIGSTTGTTSLS